MKISIITVTYNSGATLADTMASVVRQDYADIEHLVIDGGSTDDTKDIVEKYRRESGRNIVFVSEKDEGIYDAMNKGIAMATGDVVGILNSDDFFTSDDVISTVAGAFAREDIDAVYGDVHYVSAENTAKCVRYYSSRLFRPFWLRFGFMPAHPSFYVKRQKYDEAGGYKLDYKIGADYEMMVRMFFIEKIKAKYISKDFVSMRTGGVSNRNLKSRLTLISEDVRACRENGIYTNRLMICTKFLYKIFGLRF